MENEDGGPAFPHLAAGWVGMTLRDYFAAKALAALITEPVEGVQEAVAYELSDNTCEVFAAAAYKFADAMLVARSK